MLKFTAGGAIRPSGRPPSKLVSPLKSIRLRNVLAISLSSSTSESDY